MSCARPALQEDLRGAFDHATDRNDQLVIERRGRVLKQRCLLGWLEEKSPGWPSRWWVGWGLGGQRRNRRALSSARMFSCMEKRHFPVQGVTVSPVFTVMCCRCCCNGSLQTIVFWIASRRKCGNCSVTIGEAKGSAVL